MATRTIIVDDIDESTPARTVTFALDGVPYEIDLSEENEKQLRAALDKFVAVARRRRGGRSSRATKNTVEAVKASSNRRSRSRSTAGRNTATTSRVSSATNGAPANGAPANGDAAPAPSAGENNSEGNESRNSEQSVARGSRARVSAKSAPRTSTKSSAKTPSKSPSKSPAKSAVNSSAKSSTRSTKSSGKSAKKSSGKPATGASKKSSRNSRDGRRAPENATIREWAQRHNIKVGERGRVSEDVRRRYLAEH